MSDTKQLTLPITGMTCANCVATVERNLKKMDGVQSAVVNLSSERATVEFDSAKLGLAELIARIDGSFVGETWFHPVQENRLPNLFGYFGFGQGEFSKQVRDPYAVINARLTLQGANWGVTAWGRNVADEDYLAEIIPAPEFGGAFVHDAPGDSYGLDVSYRF